MAIDSANIKDVQVEPEVATRGDATGTAGDLSRSVTASTEDWRNVFGAPRDSKSDSEFENELTFTALYSGENPAEKSAVTPGKAAELTRAFSAELAEKGILPALAEVSRTTTEVARVEPGVEKIEPAKLSALDKTTPPADGKVGTVSDQQIAAALNDKNMGRDIKRDVEPIDVTVGKNDTLWGIARKHLGKDATPNEIWRHVQEIARENGIKDPNKIGDGKKLRIPGHDKDGGYITKDAEGNKTTRGKDGSVTIENKDGSGYKRGADGKEERWDKDHPRKEDGKDKPIKETEEQRKEREEAERRAKDSPELTKERTTLLETAEKKFGKDSEEYRKFTEDMRKFEDRSKRGEVSQDEVAKTYKQIDRLLNADNAKIPEAQRKVLAENIMYHAGDPKNIDQGMYNTCNVSTLQEKLFTKNPSIAAEMITSTAIDGQWKAPDGKTIKIDPQSLEPRAESRTHPPADGNRSFATQVMNNVLVNDQIQRRNPPATYSQISRNPDGSALKDGDTGERLFDTKGREILDKGKPVRSPSVLSAEMSDAVTRLTGEKHFVISNGKTDADPRLAQVNSREDLDRTLKDMKTDGKLPAVILLDSNHPAFGGRGGDKPGWHVVSITGYDEKTGKVTISNQWGSKSDREISIDDLYKSTRDHTKDGTGTTTYQQASDNFNNNDQLEKDGGRTRSIIKDNTTGDMLYLTDRKSRDEAKRIEQEQEKMYNTKDWQQQGPAPRLSPNKMVPIR
ncbi:MAG: LysM peptidoglycan-binding domain-containing protein [Leptolyngbya sp.]|nr:LysM peptidoglycan-binding domain-containing protein [Candidatus Melainabacteria bacterium]